MFLLRLLSYLPLAALYVLADLIFVFTRYVIRYRRKLVDRNLERSFPDLSAKERKAISKRFYRNLADYGVETLKLITLPKDELSKRMRFINLDLLEEYKRQGQSVIILAGHQFNWEWMLTGNYMLPLPVDFVYQKINSAFVNELSMFSRTRFGAHPVAREKVAREVIKRKHIQRCIALLADQYPGLKTDKRHPAVFLNQETVFFMGANQLAQLTGYPVVYANMIKVARGYYEVTFQIIAEPPYGNDDLRVVNNYIAALEKGITAQPENWLWSHNRWKKRHLKTRN